MGMDLVGKHGGEGSPLAMSLHQGMEGATW